MSQPGPPPAGTLPPGQVVGGRYQVAQLIGTGGFGAVYRAQQLDLGREVALKVLLDSSMGQGEALARFQREAGIASRLEHPNTVRVLDFGQGHDGIPFIAYELLRGHSLDKVLRTDAPLHPKRVIRIATQVLSSLAEAHQAGIVHRDIKPSNIFICEHYSEPDFVKVLDFGMAKPAQLGGLTELTKGGQVVGSPSYMAPEQVHGEAVSPATDLYSLGLVMAEAVSGRVVYRGRSAIEVCAEVISEAPTPLEPAVLQSPLGPVILRATQKAIARRFATSEEMRGGLELIAKGLDAGDEVPMDGTAQGVSASALDATAHAVAVARPAPPTRVGDVGPAVAPMAGMTAPGPSVPGAPIGASQSLAFGASASFSRSSAKGKARAKKVKGKGQGCVIALLVLGGLVLLGALGTVLWVAGVFGEVDARTAQRDDDDDESPRKKKRSERDDDDRDKKKKKSDADDDDDDDDDDRVSIDGDKDLRKAIKKAGWEVNGETRSSSQSFKSLQLTIKKGSDFGSVQLIEYQSAEIAKITYESMKKDDRLAVDRDGAVLLIVNHLGGDSEELLEELTD